ncbi:hypothetical protein SNE40_021645 [Patella caerulea]
MLLLCILCYMYVVEVATSTNCPEYVFRRIPLNVSITHNLFTADKGLTVKECGQKCIGTTSCASFSYLQGHVSQCYLFTRRVRLGLDQTVQPGPVTYWLLQETCPSDYTYNATNNICYKAYFDSTDLMSWAEAMNRCEEDGGYLYMANTTEKFNLIKSLNVPSRVEAYMGCTRHRGVKVTWKCLDGSDFVGEWYPGEPSSTIEDCVAIIYGNLIGALDVNCLGLRRFICEIPVRFP